MSTRPSLSTVMIRPATTSASSLPQSRSRLQRGQLPVGRSRCPYQALLALRAEKLQGRVDAVSLQGGRQGMALCVVVQLTQRSLRFTQMLQRGLLPRKSLICEQVFEEFD